jgi:hypothetical protein
MLAPDILSPRIHAQAAAVLKKLGRVHIPGFLEDDAARSLMEPMRDLGWSIAYRDGDAELKTPVKDFAALAGAERAHFMHKVYDQASNGFQHLYEMFEISAKYEQNGDVEGALGDFYLAMNSTPMLNYLRALTGDNSIAYVDAHARCYRPGYFLTEHTDQSEGENRLYAYVLNLAQAWQPDWGAQLMFIEPDGHVGEAYTPSWNAMNIFKTPQPYAVSIVAPFAQSVSYSIGGWMRAKKP